LFYVVYCLLFVGLLLLLHRVLVWRWWSKHSSSSQYSRSHWWSQPCCWSKAFSIGRAEWTTYSSIGHACCS
jgi:predicted negative regulator of RcsB-dependent stress response